MTPKKDARKRNIIPINMSAASKHMAITKPMSLEKNPPFIILLPCFITPLLDPTLV